MPVGNWTVAIYKQWNRISFEKNGSRRVKKTEMWEHVRTGGLIIFIRDECEGCYLYLNCSCSNQQSKNPKIKSNTHQERLSSCQKTAFIAPAQVWLTVTCLSALHVSEAPCISQLLSTTMVLRHYWISWNMEVTKSWVCLFWQGNNPEVRKRSQIKSPDLDLCEIWQCEQTTTSFSWLDIMAYSISSVANSW